MLFQFNDSHVFTEAEIEIYDDDGGIPGSLVVDGELSGIFADIDAGFDPAREFTWTFEPPFGLENGTYWLAGMATTSPFVFFMTSDGIPDGVASSTAYFLAPDFGTPNWTSTLDLFENRNYAFLLEGDCSAITQPTPVPTLSIHGLALLILLNIMVGPRG